MLFERNQGPSEKEPPTGTAPVSQWIKDAGTAAEIAGKQRQTLFNRSPSYEELARHIDAITLLPDGKGDTISYKGRWKLLGGTDGAEGQS